MPLGFPAQLQLVRETDHELVFADTGRRLGWALFAIGLGIVATGLGQSFLERTIKLGPLLLGTGLATPGFLVTFWVSELTFHLDTRTYTGKKGFLFSPRSTQGALDELKGIAVSGDVEYSRTGERPVWSISVWFHNGEVIDIAAFEPDEANTYKAAGHFAKVLRVPVLDSDGKETPCNKL